MPFLLQRNFYQGKYHHCRISSYLLQRMKLVQVAAVLSVCMLMSSAYPRQTQQRQRQEVCKLIHCYSKVPEVQLLW